MSDSVIKNDKYLQQLIKAFKGQIPQGRVGILGNGKARENGDSTNAAIGAAHEYGTKDGRLPVRSFLRQPITDLLGKELDKAGAFDPQMLKEVIRSGSILEWVTKVTFTAESIVIGAFDTGGYGVWRPSIMTHKKVHMTLVETQQLRNSITSEVK